MHERVSRHIQARTQGCLSLIAPFHLVLCLIAGARYEIAKFVTYDDMYPDESITQYFDPLDEVVYDFESYLGTDPDADYISSPAFTTTLIQKTAPVTIHASSETENVADKEVIAQASVLTPQEVVDIFGVEPQLDEQWFAVIHISIYPRDGGPDKIGVRTGDHSLTLTHRGINTLSNVLQAVNRIKQHDGARVIVDDAHLADGEESIQFVIVKHGKGVIIGELTSRHGEWYFTPSSDMYAYEGNPAHLASTKKNTEYPTEPECNNAMMSVDINVGPVEYTQEVFRDRCTTSLDDAIIDVPDIPPEHNVGSREEPNDPFIESEALIELYHGEDHAWIISEDGVARDSRLCGWNEELNDGQGGKNTECRAELHWWPPTDGGLKRALTHIPKLPTRTIQYFRARLTA